MHALLAIVVLLLVMYVLYWLIGYLAPPEPLNKVCVVLLVVFGLAALMNIVGFLGEPFYVQLRRW